MAERDPRLDGVEAFEEYDPSYGEIKIYETPNSIGVKALILAGMIRDDYPMPNEPRKHFDVVMYIARGGLGIVNLVPRPLRFETHQFVGAAVASYGDADQPDERFKFGQMPTREKIIGNRVLLLDEVCDTGKTLQFMNDYLVDELGATEVKTGVIYYKPGKSTTGFRPDWHVAETERWVRFPWEEFDDIGKEWYPDTVDVKSRIVVPIPELTASD